MDEEILNRLYLKVINFISYSPRSQKEISDKLLTYVSKEKLDESEKGAYVDKILGILESENYINDYKLAEEIVAANLISHKPKSRAQLKNKMYKKKIPSETIDRAMINVSAEAELDAATATLIKKAKTPDNYSSLPQRQKLIKYLLSKGFGFGVAKSAVDTFVGVK